MPLPAVVVVVAGAIAVELAAEGGVWVAKRAWHVATRKPVLNFQRPQRLYDERSGLSFTLQSNGSYRAVDGPRQL